MSGSLCTNGQLTGFQNVDVVNRFANYLRRVVTLLLQAEDSLPPEFNLSLEEDEQGAIIRRFLGDSQVDVLYVLRVTHSKGE